jgi:hypothetical protein
MESVAYWIGYLMPEIIGGSLLYPAFKAKAKAVRVFCGIIATICFLIGFLSLVGRCHAEPINSIDKSMKQSVITLNKKCPLVIDYMTVLDKVSWDTATMTYTYFATIDLAYADLTQTEWTEMQELIRQQVKAKIGKIFKPMFRQGVTVVQRYYSNDGKQAFMLVFSNRTN